MTKTFQTHARQCPCSLRASSPAYTCPFSSYYNQVVNTAAFPVFTQESLALARAAEQEALREAGLEYEEEDEGKVREDKRQDYKEEQTYDEIPPHYEEEDEPREDEVDEGNEGREEENPEQDEEVEVEEDEVEEPQPKRPKRWLGEGRGKGYGDVRKTG